jgi:hypothetical protein
VSPIWLTHLRTEIEKCEAGQVGRKRIKKEDQSLADAMRGGLGKKFPITARAIIGSAWT